MKGNFWKILLFVFTIFFAGSCNQKRQLVVSLYPYVPDAADLYWKIETKFEEEHPDINLVITLNENYYSNEPKDGGILYSDADIYEIDSVFLEDFIAKNRIQPIPETIHQSENDYVKMASIAYKENRWVGVPHWVCGNFLYSRRDDGAAAKITKLSDLEKLIPANPAIEDALIIDLKGKSTIGEMYLDSLYDEVKTTTNAAPYLTEGNLNQGVKRNLNRALKLTYSKFGRNEKYHDITGFYPRQFSRGNGRFYVGYSESMHYMLSESMNSCRDEEKCLDQSKIEIMDWPFSDEGSQPVGWVDLLTIDSRVTGQKLEDAVVFLEFMKKKDTYKKILIPSWGQAPRYLLPARSDVYTDSGVLKAAPHYEKLFNLLKNRIAFSEKDLNAKLREIGKKLDKELQN